jgi:hypothetical protein
MIDEFADQRLPDLPNDGYATRREKQLSDEIMMFLRATERDRFMLLLYVIQGREKFRRIVKRAWRHLKCDDAMADAVFGYLVLLAGPYPERQLETLKTLADAKRARLWQRLWPIAPRT